MYKRVLAEALGSVQPGAPAGERRRRDERPLIGVSASVHDFGDYGAIGVQHPLPAHGLSPAPG